MRYSAETMRGERTVLGFPQKGFSFLQSILLSFAAALMAFWGTTCIAIFSLLFWNVLGHHAVNYADTYLYIGLPAGLLVLFMALPYFGFLWLRAKLRG